MGYELYAWKWASAEAESTTTPYDVYREIVADRLHESLATIDRAAVERELREEFGNLAPEDLPFTYDVVVGGLCFELEMDADVERLLRVFEACDLYFYDPETEARRLRGDEEDPIEEARARSEFEATELRAEEGDPQAQVGLGMMYEFGDGVEADADRAFRWYSMAAAQGDRDGIFNLAGCHRQGLGTEFDAAEAARIYESLSEQKDQDAMAELASMYEVGEGVDQDLDRAISLYHAAEAAGSLAAKRALRRLDR